MSSRTTWSSLQKYVFLLNNANFDAKLTKRTTLSALHLCGREIPGQARNEGGGGGRNGYDRPFDGLRDRSSTPGMALMEQVPFGLGAGSPTSWRRWPQFLEQVWKKGVDLRHWRAWEADSWRRHPGKNLTCAKKGVHLRRTWAGPFDMLRDRSAGDSGPVVRQAHHPARPALRQQAQGPAGGRFRAGGSTSSPSGPTGPSTGSGTGRRESPGRWFDKLTIRPDRPFGRLRDRSLGDSGPVVRQAHHPARPVASTGSATGQPFFCISDGVAPNSFAKHLVKYLGSLKPTS